jgi:hypothetical protein
MAARAADIIGGDTMMTRPAFHGFHCTKTKEWRKQKAAATD